MPKLIWEQQRLKITERLELHEIYCRVIASNSAGQASATSNTVTAPRLAPVALGPVRVEVAAPAPPTVDPATSRADPLASDLPAGFTLKCLVPRYNRHVKVTYIWEVQPYAISPSGPGVPASGPFYPSDTLSGLPDTIVIAPEGEPPHSYAEEEPLIDGEPPAVPFGSWNGELAVQCGVKARILGTSVYSVTDSAVYYLLIPTSVPGTIGGRAASAAPGYDKSRPLVGRARRATGAVR